MSRSMRLALIFASVSVRYVAIGRRATPSG
jgi:hypothetical protein